MLLDHGGLNVPEFRVDVSAVSADGEELYEHEILAPARCIRFERAEAEVAIGSIRPDVVCYRGDRRLLVEMFFRHRVDPEKRAKLRTLGLPALEIDLSDLDGGAGFALIVKRVVDETLYKEWLVYPGAVERAAVLRASLAARVQAANRSYHD